MERSILLVPMTRVPPGPRDIGLPETVMGVPSGFSVALAIGIAAGLAVKVWSPTV